MLILEYGGPVYDIEITPDSAYATNVQTREKNRVAQISTEHDQVILELYAPGTVHRQKTVVGRVIPPAKNIFAAADAKLEETLWDE